MYALKKLWLRLSLGRGPKLPPHLAQSTRVRLDNAINGTFRDENGLCDLVKGQVDSSHNDNWWVEYEQLDDWLRHQFKLWPHNSGIQSFPVPSPRSELSPSAAYFKLAHWEGEYGRMRINLAKHLHAACIYDLGIKR